MKWKFARDEIYLKSCWFGNCKQDGLVTPDDSSGVKTKPSTPVAQAPRYPDRFSQPMAASTPSMTASPLSLTDSTAAIKSCESTLKTKLNADGKTIHKTEMSFPVGGVSPSSGTPCGTPCGTPRERIIPIRVEGRDPSSDDRRSVSSMSSIPTTPRTPNASNHFLTPPPVAASPPPAAATHTARVKPIHLK